MVTNEELSLAAQAGDQNALFALWEQCRGLIYVIAKRRYSGLELGGTAHGVDMDDLMQSGFLGLVDAVGRYDPKKDFLFNSYLTNCLKTAFSEALGARKRDPLSTAVSLEMPLGDDPEGDTLEAVVPNPENNIEDAAERIFREQLHNTLEAALSECPTAQERALRLRFYNGLYATQVAAVLGLKYSEVQRLINNGLQKLRRHKYRAELEQFVDFRTNFFLRGNAARQESPVEKNVLRREDMRQRNGWAFSGA